MLIQMLTDVTVLLILLTNTYTDIKRREVLLSTILLGGVVGISLHLYLLVNDYSPSLLLFWAAGFLPGLLLLILSYVLPAQIGMGDALLILSLGSLLGGRRILVLLFASLSLSCLFSILLLITRKAGRKSTIPFVPFLFAALPICCILKT